MTQPAFILQDIAPDDRADLVRLAAADAEVERTLAAAVQHDIFPESRAVDQASGWFLMTWPQLTRAEGLERSFVLFAEQKFFVFSIGGRLDNVTFARGREPSEASGDAVRHAIVKAFEVHGRYGQGPIDESGVPDWAVRPTFA